MIVFGSSMSPFVRKVLVFAAEKGIEVDSRPTGIGSDDPEFLAASPFRKIPAFVDGDYALADSSAIVQYLEAKFPARADPRRSEGARQGDLVRRVRRHDRLFLLRQDVP